MKSRLRILVACGFLNGCTISAISTVDEGSSGNSCSSDSDCSNNQKCGAGICQSVNGTIESLLITVTPPSNSPAPHVTFVSHIENVPTRGGPIPLPALRAAQITGSLVLAAQDRKCYPTFPEDGPKKYRATEDSSLPVSVVLFPREQVLGLPQQLYVTSAYVEQSDLTYRYSLQVPPGSYDAYFTLPKGQAGCVVPPQLFRGQTISGDTTLNYTASVRSQLDLHIVWPKGNPPLTGWRADIVEPIDGNVISSEVVLGEPVDTNPARGDAPVDYAVPLVYSTVNTLDPAPIGEPKAAEDLVRLRPPEGLAAPTIYLDRTAFGLFNSKPILTAFTRYPTPVRIEARVERAEDGAPVPSQVTLVSTEIVGMDGGVLSAYQRIADVGEDGQLSVDLPPGRYRVHVVPLDSDGSAAPLASLEEEWTVAADLAVQGGRVLELKTGVGFSARSSFEEASLWAQPSASRVLPFAQIQGRGSFPLRSRSARVQRGVVSLGTDPGRFDLSLRGAESQGFAWWVRPGVLVGEESQDLGTLSLLAPTVVSATATAIIPLSSVPVGLGSVSAYVYLDKDFGYTRDPSQAVSVVQVAGTRADEDGNFKLLIPPQLAAKATK